jgi:hypothetical protein
MMPPTPRNQPPIGPSQPDDLMNYDRKGMFGQMASMVKSGWHHSALFKLSLRVGSGTALAAIDGTDGQIGADGINASIFFADRSAPRTASAGWYRNGTHVRLNTSDAGDIWDVDPTTGIFNLSAWTVISSFTNSWVDAGGALGVSTVRYRKDLFGNVQLVGTIKTGTIGSAAFSLPSGSRPFTTLFLPGIDVGTSGVARFDVQAGGAVIPQSGTNTTGLAFNFIFATV